MFQDEGRFWAAGLAQAVLGATPRTPDRRCASPQRKFVYAFAAVSPHDGVMDSLVLPWVNAETMSLFPATVAERHANGFIVMVMDQAGWHIASDLIVPDNMRPVYLPAYSPELNPAEHLWESLRENRFGNTVARDLDAVEEALVDGLRSMEADLPRTQKLTGFDWPHRCNTRAAARRGTSKAEERLIDETFHTRSI